MNSQRPVSDVSEMSPGGDGMADGRPGVVKENVSCIHCDYNLRGLDPAGRCPECGSEIANSVLAPILKRTEPSGLPYLKWSVVGVAILALGGLLTAAPLWIARLDTSAIGGVLLTTGLAVEIWVFLLSLTALWRPPWKDRRAVTAALTVSFIFGIVPVAIIVIALIATTVSSTG
jgi:hypothetical protein